MIGFNQIILTLTGTLESSAHTWMEHLFWIAPAGSILALIFAFIFFKSVVKKDEGTDTMKRIAQHVREGAMAYLKQQYKVVAIFFGVAFLFFIFLALVLKVQSLWVPFAFLSGGFFSGLAGLIGMNVATLASSRTTNAARNSLDGALKIAFRSGAVMGLTVVGLGLLDISIWFVILKYFTNSSLTEITVTMLSFGIGASSQALFARVGGGIFTKAADVGADLVGKVEQGIPEDDPRNPATIADNVGDNVGDAVGDPFKDTSGPSLNILIKLMSMVSVVVAGLTVSYHVFGK